MQAECEPALSPADVAVHGHALTLETAEQRIEPVDSGASAVTTDSVRDRGNLAHFIERDASLASVLQPLASEHVRCVDPFSRSGVWPGRRAVARTDADQPSRVEAHDDQ